MGKLSVNKQDMASVSAMRWQHHLLIYLENKDNDTALLGQWDWWSSTANRPRRRIHLASRELKHLSPSPMPNHSQVSAEALGSFFVVEHVQEAKICVFLLKIENCYNKSGLRFVLSCKINEKIFYSNSYTVRGQNGSPVNSDPWRAYLVLVLLIYLGSNPNTNIPPCVVSTSPYRCLFIELSS